MRFHGFQERVVGSRSKVKLLRVLFKFAESEFTGDDLARKAGVSKPMAHRALSELMAENVVARRVAGRAYLYRLVPGSYSVRLVAPLFQNSESPLGELGRLFSRKLQSSPVVSAVLYGSLARGEGGPESDIDVYLIVKRAEDRERVETMVADLNRATLKSFGNRLSAMVKTLEESRRAYRERRGLELEVESQGRVLAGLSPREAWK